MKFNGQEVRLGLNKGVQNPKRYDLLFKNSFELPAPPPHVDWTKGQKNWGMMKNDQLGDCTAAGVGHHQPLRATGARLSLINPIAPVTEPVERRPRVTRGQRVQLPSVILPPHPAGTPCQTARGSERQQLTGAPGR